MKRVNKVAGTIGIFSLLFSFVGPLPALAATAPDLGAAETYAVYGDAGVTNDLSATTHIWGNVGHNGLGATNLDDATQVDGVIDVGAGVAAAASAAYDAMDAQGADGALDLDGGGTVTPGVYTVGAGTLNGTLILDGEGVYIFRSDSSISTSGPAVVSLINGASACDVFWQIPTSMTIGADSEIVGTIITQTGLISLASGASLEGRALAKTQVTMVANQITEPVCATPTTGGGSGSQPLTGTITVVKTIINDNGEDMVVEDFPLFVNGLPVVSGQTNTFAANSSMYTVTESGDDGYTSAFSGDCDANGVLYLYAAQNLFCVVTNNDIGAPVAAAAPLVPPLIDVVKVPSPLALPDGPGSVTYTYAVRNVGTVAMTDVTVVDDSCSPVFVSGDTDSDDELDVTETWSYRCTEDLTETHSNTVVATGWANGMSSADVAVATVVVGTPVVPPLIHVTKVPSPLALLAGGGAVTYTETITNPGTVPLSNVELTDDKCDPVNYISGDTNSDALLDPDEAWVYTCVSNLTATTTNTAIASGEANGFTVRDLAVATVVVTAAAVPALPNAGISVAEGIPAAGVFLASIFAVTLFLYTMGKKKNI